MANLSGANLYESKLSEANLSVANLRGASLYESNLSGADLSGAITSWGPPGRDVLMRGMRSRRALARNTVRV